MDRPAAWRPDPTGRHELRYRDATGWTARVSGRPLAPGTGVPPPPAPLVEEWLLSHTEPGEGGGGAGARVRWGLWAAVTVILLLVGLLGSSDGAAAPTATSTPGVAVASSPPQAGAGAPSCSVTGRHDGARTSFGC